jgi:hypothetical protein
LKWEFGGNTQNVEFDFSIHISWIEDILVGNSFYYTRRTGVLLLRDLHPRSLDSGRTIHPLDKPHPLVTSYSLLKEIPYTNHNQIDLNPTSNKTLIELDSLGWRYTSSFSATINRIPGTTSSSQPQALR